MGNFVSACRQVAIDIIPDKSTLYKISDSLVHFEDWLRSTKPENDKVE